MKLFCRQFGTGKPVVILHGLFGLSDNWVTFGRQLGEHYRVLIPDLRNHGQSPHSNVFDFSSLENDLLELAEEYELTGFFLIGHSLGGKLRCSSRFIIQAWSQSWLSQTYRFADRLPGRSISSFSTL